MILPSFCGVGVELGWAGNTSNMLKYLSSQEQYALYTSLSPLSPTMEMSLAVHSCRAKAKWSCLVFKRYGTHTNCCPGADSLFSTLKCFNCFLPHNLWVILTSWSNCEWGIHLFLLPHCDFQNTVFRLTTTHSFLNPFDQLLSLYLFRNSFPPELPKAPSSYLGDLAFQGHHNLGWTKHSNLVALIRFLTGLWSS